MIDEDEVDYRDVLSALSIIEHYASKLGVNLHDLVLPLCVVASMDRRDTIINGYFSRTPEMRTIEVMGYKEVGGNITKIPW